MRRKAIVKSDMQQAFITVPDLLQRKGQLPVPQIIPQLHAGYFPEFPCGIELGISQPAGETAQRQRFILIVFYAAVDFINNHLDLLLPFVHVLFYLVSPL